MKNVNDANVGDSVDPDSLPPYLRMEGGGWVKVAQTPTRWHGATRSVYVCDGAHKDGRSGWVCIEIRNDGRS